MSASERVKALDLLTKQNCTGNVVEVSPPVVVAALSANDDAGQNLNSPESNLKREREEVALQGPAVSSTPDKKAKSSATFTPDKIDSSLADARVASEANSMVAPMSTVAGRTRSRPTSHRTSVSRRFSSVKKNPRCANQPPPLTPSERSFNRLSETGLNVAKMTTEAGMGIAASTAKAHADIIRTLAEAQLAQVSRRFSSVKKNPRCANQPPPLTPSERSFNRLSETGLNVAKMTTEAGMGIAASTAKAHADIIRTLAEAQSGVTRATAPSTPC